MIFPKWFPPAALAIFLGTSASAAEIEGAKTSLAGSEVRIALGSGYFNAILTVAGPNGFHARAESKSGTVSIDLIKAGAKGEGLYTYEVTAASNQTETIAKPLDNGRGDGVDKAVRQKGVSMAGNFSAANGLIKAQTNMTEESQ